MSFVQWNSISKLKKWAIKRSYILSFISLLFWLLPTIFFVKITSSHSLSFWDIFPVLLYFILLVDVYIMKLSGNPFVNEFLKTQ
jgi:hypothetical protein